MPRLFTCIKLPDEITRILALKRGKLKGARWIERQDFHVTLRFIGDVDDAVAREIEFALAAIKQDRFQIRLHGLDLFGSKRPRTLFAAVDTNKALINLHNLHEKAMRRIGLAPERRNFAPHVTLARLGGARREAILEFMQNTAPFSPLEFNAEGFSLFSAKNSIGGGPYLEEARYEF